jgi:hypothetical protein
LGASAETHLPDGVFFHSAIDASFAGAFSSDGNFRESAGPGELSVLKFS